MQLIVDVPRENSLNNLTDEITELMGQFERPLLRYATGILRNADSAQDIVQDVFIRYLKMRGEGKSVDNVSAWLYRVAHNLAIDHIRRHKRVTEMDEGIEATQLAPDAAPDDALSRRDATRAAMASLDVLTERDREIVFLKVMEEKSYKEIAEIMELTVTNVGFILHRAMKKLAQELERKLA